MDKNHQLQVIVLKGFCNQTKNSEASDMFIKLLDLKFKGYQTKHSDKFLPVGTHDFFAHHLIVCEKSSMKPIICSKIVTSQDCLYYNCSFPLYELKNVFSPELWLELQKIMTSRISVGKNISYSGGFTINPEFKGRGMSAEFKDIYSGLHYLSHIEEGISTVLGFGAPIVGTDKFFKLWGGDILSVQGQEMKPVKIPFANDLESLLIWKDVNQLSEYKKNMADKYLNLWKERIEYSVKTDALAA
jgi:hypothetical protein